FFFFEEVGEGIEMVDPFFSGEEGPGFESLAGGGDAAVDIGWGGGAIFAEGLVGGGVERGESRAVAILPGVVDEVGGHRSNYSRASRSFPQPRLPQPQSPPDVSAARSRR